MTPYSIARKRLSAGTCGTSLRGAAEGAAVARKAPKPVTTASSELQTSPHRIPRSQQTARHQRAVTGLLALRGEHWQVSHFSAGPCAGLSVQVQFDVGQRQCGRPVRFAVAPEVAELVHHGG